MWQRCTLVIMRLFIFLLHWPPTQAIPPACSIPLKVTVQPGNVELLLCKNCHSGVREVNNVSFQVFEAHESKMMTLGCGDSYVHSFDPWKQALFRITAVGCQAVEPIFYELKIKCSSLAASTVTKWGIPSRNLCMQRQLPLRFHGHDA